MINLIVMIPILLLMGCEGLTDPLSSAVYKHSDLNDQYNTAWKSKTKRGSGDTLRILFYGTSLTYGTSGNSGVVDSSWPKIFMSSLTKSYTGLIILGKENALPGRTSQDAINSCTSECFIQQDIIFIELGTNDAMMYTELETYRRNIDSLLNIVPFSTDVILISPPPALCRYAKPLIEYTSILSEQAKKNKIGFINMNRRIGEQFDQSYHPRDLMPDCIHFTQSGYRLFSEEVLNWFLTIDAI